MINSDLLAIKDLEKMVQGHVYIHNVRFYSIYLVVDEVIITTKHNDNKHHVWKSQVGGSFAVTKDTTSACKKWLQSGMSDDIEWWGLYSQLLI